MKARLFAAAAMAGLLGVATHAHAQIKLGAILSISGPGAAMGVGYKGAFEFFPKEIGGQKIEYRPRSSGWTEPLEGTLILVRVQDETNYPRPCSNAA